MATAFISYSRKDTEVVRRLHAALEQHGLEGWVDWEGIPPADDWLRKVYAAIEGADAFLFVMSPDSLSSAVCADEVAHAVAHNKRLIPVVVREADRLAHPEVQIPEPLRRLNWVFFRPADDFGAAVEKLVAAIQTDLVWVESHTRLLGRAIEWQAARRDDSFLLQKNDLVAAEQWLTRAPDKDPKPTVLQSDFIVASRTAATRRQRRLTVAAVAAAILVGIGAIVATVQYVIAEVRREEALSRQLAAQSASSMDESPELGLLLGVSAHDVAPTVEAGSALLAALDRVRGVRAFVPGEHRAGTLALSADGALMAVARCAREGCSGSAIDVWQVAGPRRIGTVEVEPGVWRMAFSSDARRLAATLCCVAEGDKERTRALTFDLVDDPSATGALKLVKAAEGVFDRWHEPPPRARLADAAAVAATSEALDRVRRAAGASPRAFSGTPAGYGPEPRVLATIGGGDLNAPVQVELWDAGNRPRRLARGVLRSPVVGDRVIRADGALAAAYGCAVMASGRICDHGELVITDATGKEPRVGTVRYNLPDWIRSLAVLPGEPLVLSGGCGKHDLERCLYGELRLWRVEYDGEEPTGYEPVRTFGGAVDAIALSADGKAMGVTSQRGQVSLLRLDGPHGERGWLASPLAARFAGAGRDPRPPLTCGKDVVKNPLLTRAASQLQAPAELCAALEAFVPGINRTSIDERTVTAASASGTRLALGGCAARKRDTAECQGGRTTVWSIADRRFRRLASVDTPTEVTMLALAPDGDRLAMASCSGDTVQSCEDGRLELVELAREGPPRRTVADRVGAVTAITFRPGTDTLAYATCARLDDTGAVRGCALGAVRLLGPAPAFAADATLTGHRGAITDLAFSPDGALLVSGASDGSVALWDPAHRERLGPVIPAHAGPVVEIRFGSAEAFTSSTGSDEIEWRATPAQWKSTACRIANRPLTEAEHTRYLGAGETFTDPCATPGRPRGSALWRWIRGLAKRFA